MRKRTEELLNIAEVQLRVEELLTSLKYAELTTTEVLGEAEALQHFTDLLK